MDLPVSKDDSNIIDTPKGFSRLLRFKEMAIKRQQEKKEAKLNMNAGTAPVSIFDRHNLFFLSDLL
jgi:hypothetical protein